MICHFMFKSYFGNVDGKYVHLVGEPNGNQNAYRTHTDIDRFIHGNAFNFILFLLSVSFAYIIITFSRSSKEKKWTKETSWRRTFTMSMRWESGRSETEERSKNSQWISTIWTIFDNQMHFPFMFYMERQDDFQQWRLLFPHLMSEYSMRWTHTLRMPTLLSKWLRATGWPRRFCFFF